MAWKHVGDARLLRSQEHDTLLIDIGVGVLYSVSVPAARETARWGKRTRLSCRYAPDREDYGSNASLSRSHTGVAVTFAIDGRLYAINRGRLEEVLDGLTLAVRVVERIDEAAQLSDASGQQTTLGAF